MNKHFGWVLASVMILGAGQAKAADMAVKALPPVAPVVDWTGFYLGINAGYGVNTNTGYGLAFNPAGVPNGVGTAAQTGNVVSATGGLAGGTAGYNFQKDRIVWGIETDIQWSGIKGSGSVSDPCCNPGLAGGPGLYTASQNMTWFGTTRGRVGFLATPNLLFFGTGGAFYGHNDLTANISFPGAGVFQYPSSNGTTRIGWTAGAGFEYLFVRGWSAKVEGLYYDMGTTSSSFTCPVGSVTCTPGFTQTGNFALRGGIVRAGINYHFSGPVVAKY